MASAEDYGDVRIVITGVGGVSPVGDVKMRSADGSPTAWSNTLAGYDGVTDIGETDMSSFADYEKIVPLKLAAGVKEDIDNNPFIRESRHDSKYWGRAGKMAAIAIHDALESAKVDLTSMDRWRIGHYMGSVFGGNGYSHLVDVSREKLAPAEGTKNLFGQVGLGPASFFELKGRGGVEAVECASSSFAAESGITNLLPWQFGRELRPPIADMVIFGGTDGTFVPEPAAHFVKAFRGAPDTMTEDPRQAPRPFDRNTKGFIIGEGAVVMVAESWDKAQERGVKEEDVLAEIVGFNSLTDAYNVTLAGLEGQVRTMETVLKMAEVALGDTVYVRGHGTGTLAGDAREALAVREVIRRLGLDPEDFYINSTMWATGHMMGPAGIMGLYYAAMSAKFAETPIPQKITEPIPELTDPVKELNLEKDLAELAKYDLPQIPEKNLLSSTAPKIAISNAYGFSGGGTTIGVKKFIA